jgi:uncharacterized protein (DUF2384 family)
MTHSAAPPRRSSPSSSGSPSPESDPADGVRAGAVLSKALVRASARLGLSSQKELAEVLGVSAPTVSRLLRGARPLDPASNEGQRATLFLRIWRSLDALVGGDERAASAWFHAANHHLGAPPVELARSITGLVHVADYLDAMRGKV